MTDGNSTRVLYIEDDKNLQVSISQMLKILGYEVACADNGKEGVALAESWQPDAILTDVRMPFMNGDEVIRTLRKNLIFAIPRFLSCPLIPMPKHAGHARRPVQTGFIPSRLM